jgi:hypothetical protein
MEDDTLVQSSFSATIDAPISLEVPTLPGRDPLFHIELSLRRSEA